MTEQPRYPLAEHAADELRARSGRPLDSITLDAAATDELTIADVQISAATLHAQAMIAQQAGYDQLAANLTRAAELTAVPNAEVLRMYELLRPGRATYAELIEVASTLGESYGARENAALIREAAAVYQARGLLRQE